MQSFLRLSVLLGVVLSCAGCTHAGKPITHPVAPRSPTRDSGKKSESNNSSQEQHAAALEQLAVADFDSRHDRQRSVRIPLPDGGAWRRVRFLGIKSLVGFRYGSDHHAVVGAFVIDVPNRTPETCNKAFEDWAKPWLEIFDVRYEYSTPVGFAWRNPLHPNEPAEILSAITLHASTATLMASESYHATYTIYPAWPNKCLVVGMAAPARGEEQRAQKARDRFAAEAFKQLEITADVAPTKAF